MVVSPLKNKAIFSVSCPQCKIEKTMAFISPIRHYLLASSIRKIDNKAKVPPFYKYEEIFNIENTGKQKENFLKPIKGLFGDKLLARCPKCGTKLKAVMVRCK